MKKDAYTVAFKITGLMYDMLVEVRCLRPIPVLSGYIARDDEETGWKCRYFYKHCYCCHGCSVLFRNNFAPQVVSLMAQDLKQMPKTAYC